MSDGALAFTNSFLRFKIMDEANFCGCPHTKWMSWFLVEYVRNNWLNELKIDSYVFVPFTVHLLYTLETKTINQFISQSIPFVTKPSRNNHTIVVCSLCPLWWKVIYPIFWLPTIIQLYFAMSLSQNVWTLFCGYNVWYWLRDLKETLRYDQCESCVNTFAWFLILIDFVNIISRDQEWDSLDSFSINTPICKSFKYKSSVVLRIKMQAIMSSSIFS